MGSQLQFGRTSQNRLPSQEPSQRILQVLVASLVRSEEYQGIAIETGDIAPRLEDFLCFELRWTRIVFDVSVVWTEHHQPAFELIRHIGTYNRQEVYPRKVTLSLKIALER